MKRNVNTRRISVGLCALPMTLGGTLALWWWGLSRATALAVAIGGACSLSALYAWRLSRHALRALDNAGTINHAGTTRTP